MASSRQARGGGTAGAPAGRAHAVIGPVLVLISAISFGFMPLFSHWAAGVGLEMKLGLRFVIGAALLTGLALKEKTAWPRGRNLLALVLLGAAVYFVEAYSYFGALARGTPSGLVALLLYLYPVSVTIGAWLLFRERLSRLRWIALGLAMAGLVLTIGPMELRSGSGIPGGLAGIGLGLAAGVAYAVYILSTSRVVTKETAMTASAVVCWSAAAVFLGLAAARHQALPATGMGVLGVVMLGTVSTAIALTCFLAGSAWIGPVRASTLSIVEPVTTVAVGWMLLGETVTGVQLAGGALILVGAALAARKG